MVPISSPPHTTHTLTPHTTHPHTQALPAHQSRKQVLATILSHTLCRPSSPMQCPLSLWTRKLVKQVWNPFNMTTGLSPSWLRITRRGLIIRKHTQQPMVVASVQDRYFLVAIDHGICLVVAQFLPSPLTTLPTPLNSLPEYDLPVSPVTKPLKRVYQVREVI